MYKLIGIDMDGTLLNSKHTLSKENKEAIESARAQGISVVITTGRPLSGVENVLKTLNMSREDDYIILYNGALILRASDRSIVADHRLSQEEIQELYKLSEELGVQIHLVTDTACIAPYPNKYGAYEAELNNMAFEIHDFEALPPDTKVYKVMFSEEANVLKETMNALSSTIKDTYETSMSAPFYIDFLKKDVHKGNGIKCLSEKISVDQKHIICIGDAGNDLSMVDYASLGVAMGNASLELRRMADYITLDNDEHGVAHVIKRFALTS